MSLSEAVQSVAQAVSQEDALRRAYDILTSRYHGERMKTGLLFWRLFEQSPERLWSRTGFLHCTKLNQLLGYLLVQSSWFKPEDVIPRWTFIWFVSPHQYTLVRLHTGTATYVDVWGAAYGIPFGDYAHGFH